MRQYCSRKTYGLPCRIFVAAAVIIIFLTGSIGTGRASGMDPAYGLSVSDLSEYSGIKRDRLTEGVQNILRRGRQMYEITWTAQADILSYPGAGQELTFRAGTVYQGIPYGQPVHTGRYVGFSATLEEFAAAAADAASEMYTTRGENTWDYSQGNGAIKYAPFYSSDCSAFISYVWELPGRYTTSMIAERTVRKGKTGYQDAMFQYVGRKISDLKVGYALNKGASHIILIYDIVYDRFGNIIQVTTLEQTPPIMRLRVWGAGGNAGSLQDLQNKIDSAPYDIIRYKEMESVTFQESSAVPLNSESYRNRISAPISAAASDGSVTGSAGLAEERFSIEGWTYHKNGTSAVEYQIDGGAWRQAETETASGVTRFRAEAEASGGGEHAVSVRGTSTEGVYQIAEFTVYVGADPLTYTVNFDNLGGMVPQPAKDEPVKAEFSFDSPSAGALSFTGWAVSSGGVKGYEYQIDDGFWMPLEAGFRRDVYRAMKAYQESCDAYNQFTGGMSFANLTGSGTHTLSIRGITDSNEVFPIAEIEVRLGSATYRILGLDLTRTAWILVIAGAVVVLAAIVTVLILVIRRKRKQKPVAAKELQQAAETAASDDGDETQ